MQSKDMVWELPPPHAQGTQSVDQGLQVTVLPALLSAVSLRRVAATGVREAAALGPHRAPDGRQGLHRVPALGE